MIDRSEVQWMIDCVDSAAQDAGAPSASLRALRRRLWQHRKDKPNVPNIVGERIDNALDHCKRLAESRERMRNDPLLLQIIHELAEVGKTLFPDGR